MVDYRFMCKQRVRFSDRLDVFVLEDNDSGSSSAEDVPSLPPPRVDPRKGARERAYQLIPKGYGHLLKNSFEDETSGDNNNNKTIQENLNAFVAGVPDQDNARGLERYLSPQHRDERDGAHEDVVEAVLSKQTHMSSRRHGVLSQDERAEKLRAASRKHSRTSRTFARRMGIADELAVKEDDDDDVYDQNRIHALQQQQPQQHHQQKRLHWAGTKEDSAHAVPSLSSLFRRGDSSRTTFGNAKMARRQPSTRQLDTGIRSMAASMNAKKACRQASIRQLNVSIRNLASSLHASSHHLQSSTSSFSESESFGADDISVIHPSLVVSHRDRALKVPGRPKMSKVTECADLIQSALDLVDCTNEPVDEEMDTSIVIKGSARSVALSA